MMVEVFKTNITDPKKAEQLCETLTKHYPQSRINFDLEDSDNILRVEDQAIDVNHIVALLTNMGYVCAIIE